MFWFFPFLSKIGVLILVNSCQRLEFWFFPFLLDVGVLVLSILVRHWSFGSINDEINIFIDPLCLVMGSALTLVPPYQPSTPHHW